MPAPQTARAVLAPLAVAASAWLFLYTVAAMSAYANGVDVSDKGFFVLIAACAGAAIAGLLLALRQRTRFATMMWDRYLLWVLLGWGLLVLLILSVLMLSAGAR